MERRKFLLGVGSTAIGAGAVIGSSAFSSVEAQRTAEATLVGDDDALLRLVPRRDDYASWDADDRLTLHVDNLNQAARTRIEGIYRIQNQGNRTVRVFLDGAEADKPYDGDNDDVPHQVDAGRVQAPVTGGVDNLWDTVSAELGPGDHIDVGKVLQPMEGTSGGGTAEDDFEIVAYEPGERDLVRDRFEDDDNIWQRDFPDAPAIGGEDEDTT